MPQKSDSQTGFHQSDLIVIKLSYDRKLILPIADGFEILKLMATGIEIKEEYNKPPRIVSKRDDFTVSFMTQQKLKEIMLEGTLDPAGDT